MDSILIECVFQAFPRPSGYCPEAQVAKEGHQVAHLQRPYVCGEAFKRVRNGGFFSSVYVLTFSLSAASCATFATVRSREGRENKDTSAEIA